MATTTSAIIPVTKTPKLQSDGSLRVYFSQLDDYFNRCAITADDEKIYLFKFGLSSDDYKKLVFGTTLPTRYEDLRTTLISAYDPDPSDIVVKDLFVQSRQLPGESVCAFGQRLLKEAERAYPSIDPAVRTQLTIDQLKRGLRHHRLREEAHVCGLHDFPDLLKHLRIREEACQLVSTPVCAVTSPDSTDIKLRELSRAMEGISKRLDELALQGQPRLQRPPRTCWNCGMRGHISSFCRAPTATCSSCGGPHPARFCRQQKPVSSNDCGQIASIGSQVIGIFVVIKNSTHSAMIDTGASLSLLSECLWENVGKPALQASSKSLIAANSTPIDVMGTVCLPVRMSDICVDQEFLVVKDLSFDCILGKDFLSANTCKIDFESRSLRIASEAIPFFSQYPDTVTPVCAVADVILPPFSETIVRGYGQDRLRAASCFLVTKQATLNPRLTGKTLVASCLVASTEHMPICVMNVSNEPIRVKKDEVLAKVETVQEAEDELEDTTEAVADDTVRWSELFPLPNLTEDQRTRVYNILKTHRHVFAMNRDELGKTSRIEHEINTGNLPPTKVAYRRIPSVYRAEIDDQLQWLLKKNIVRPSNSPWSAPIVMAKKKDNSLRMCIDYRKLNEKTIKDSFPLPHISEILDSLSECTQFSTIDLSSGYLQVPLKEDDCKKTAFVTHRGLYEYTRLPFGVCNGPATFSRLMSSVLEGMIGHRCLVYLDDIIVFSRNFQQHLDHLQSVLGRLSEAGLTVKPTKCHLFQKEVTFLGHVVSESGVHVDETKVDIIKEWPTPQQKAELRTFLGLAGYYRRFVQNYAKIAAPLTKLTGKEPFRWSTEAQTAFDTLKKHLTEAPILAFPNCRPDAPTFVLDTDASDSAIGGVLSQEIDGVERVIAFASRSLSKPEKHYCTTRRELLALVHFTRHFRPYLLGRHFYIRTDHASLTWLQSLKDIDGQLARWLLSLQEFQFTIMHRAGDKHQNADALSRYPHQGIETCPSCTSTENSQDLHVNLCATACTNNLLDYQSQDHDINIVMGALNENLDLSDLCQDELTEYGTALANNMRFLAVENGLLLFKRDDKSRPVIPRSLVNSLLSEIHSGPGGGHFGVNKTIEKVTSRFWWPDYQTDVKSFLRGCDVCARSKDPVPNSRGELQPIVSARFNQILAMDIMGPLPTTTSGNRYLLVLIDHFTKWVEACPLPDQTSATTIEKVFEAWISRYGTPERIHTDQGPNFESNEFATFCRSQRIRKSHSSPYHPQGNGLVERCNRTFKMLLKTHVESESEWDLCLPTCLMAYRSSVQESTKFSPFQLLFGNDMRIPCDGLTNLPTEDRRPGAVYLDLKSRLHTVRSAARQNQNNSRTRQAKYHNKRAHSTQYSVGDAVWLQNEAITGHPKFHRPWKGPYSVIEILPPLNYRLRYFGSQSGKTQVVHHDRLKPCHDPERALHRTPLPSPFFLRRPSAESWHEDSFADDEHEVPFVEPRFSVVESHSNNTLTEATMHAVDPQSDSSSTEPMIICHNPPLPTSSRTARRTKVSRIPIRRSYNLRSIRSKLQSHE